MKAAGLMLAAIGMLAPTWAAAEFPRDLQGRWAAPGRCGAGPAIVVQGDRFALNGRRCLRYRAVCTFWKEAIKPGADCTVVVDCEGDMAHGVFMLTFADRNTARLGGAFDKPGTEVVEKVSMDLARCPGR